MLLSVNFYRQKKSHEATYYKMTEYLSKLIIIIVILIVVSLTDYQVRAAEVNSLDFINQLIAVLEDPIPPLSEVLPGYARPTEGTPSLVVADLTSANEDKEPWGNVIGRVLRRKIMFAPKVILRMPDIQTLRDEASSSDIPQRDVLRSLNSIKLVGRRLGIENALTGNVEIQETRFTLSLQLRKLPSGEIYKRLDYTCNVSELPEAICKAAHEVYQSLGVKSDQKTRQYLSIRTPATFDDLKDFMHVMSKLKNINKQEAFGEISKLMDKPIFSPAAASLLLYYMERDKDLHVYLKRLDKVYAKYPDDAGIELLVASYMGYKDAPDLVKNKIMRFQKIIRENPQDISAMLKYSDFLTEYGYTLAALTVCKETLQRLPEQYRVWWSLSYTLIEHAFKIRGSNFWKDVPDKGKRIFPPMRVLAERAADRALQVNQGSSNLWAIKMRTVTGYSPETMASFHRAIQIDPHNQYAYDIALCYSRPQWGGSYEAQEEIWELAAKNNPGQPWLKEIREKYMTRRP